VGPLLITAFLVSCKPEDAEPGPRSFGEGFLWGTAIAGFQVDPGCPTIDPAECEDRHSDWFQWVTDPDLIADSNTYLSGDPLADGPGHYELYVEDFRRAREELGTGALRTSIEWSRLFPDGVAESATTVEELAAHADPVAVAHYHAYFDAIASAGLVPLVTLNHYTLPLWLHDGKSCHFDMGTCTDRGWLDLPRMKAALSLYAGFCAREFGDRVDLWGTLNEPLAVVLAGYLLPSADRTNPPGIVEPDLAVQVMFNEIEGHAVMVDAVHAYDAVDADGDGLPSRVGLVANLAATAPLDPENELDVQGAAHLDYVYNRVFLNGAVLGEFDRNLDGVAEEHRDDIAGRMDFVGVNYYTRITARGLSRPLFSAYPWFDFYPEILWEPYAPGMADVVGIVEEYGLPSIICENGTTPDDTAGETFLRPHLESLRDGMDAGSRVEGYFWWSLVDNYEWNHGMGMRFGLYELDIATKARTLRPIGGTYAEIVGANAI